MQYGDSIFEELTAAGCRIRRGLEGLQVEKSASAIEILTCNGKRLDLEELESFAYDSPTWLYVKDKEVSLGEQ